MKIRYEDEMTTTRLGKALREKRGGLSLREIAPATGLTVATLSRLENGARPDVDTFQIAMEWLDIPTDQWPKYMDFEKK